MFFLKAAQGNAATAVFCIALALSLSTLALGFEDPDDMPEGAGREAAFFSCIACHSMQVVTRQGMTREMWEDTITLMVNLHGMPDLEPDERAEIVDYLSEHFPARGGSRRGWTNPFAP